MSLITDKLNTYINYLEKVKKNPDYEPTSSEKEANYYVNNDASLKGVITELNSTNDYLRRKEIINSFGTKNNSNVVDISKISHYKLNNGNEVYSFIDSNGVRRVVENNKLGDISSQLNEKDFIMEDMIKNNNTELNMVQIDEFMKDPNNFKNLDKNELDNLKAIIANKDQMKIKYINKENMVLLDENGNVLEAYYDQNDNTSKIGTPDSIKYNQNELSDESNVETKTNNQNNDIKSEIKDGETEEEKNNFSPEFIEKVNKEIEDKQIKVSLDDALRNIPLYYEVPTKIDSDFNAKVIDENEKEFYDNMTSLYAEELAKKKADKMAKTLDLSKDNRGIASVFLLAMILFVVAVIILFNMK